MTATLRHRASDLIQNRYRVEKLLGSGAFGTVYACRDAELDEMVAVKELHVLDENRAAPGEREEALQQFRAEAIHLSRLRHPHIVSGHYEPFNGSWRICPVCGLDFPEKSRCPEHNAALFALKSRHYLVMEYLAGPDLLEAAAQNGGVLDIEDALLWAEHIASALAHIHGKGYVHRDIKPENIRLREGSDEAVLLDFGIAAQSEQEAPTGKYGTLPQRARHTQGGGTVGYAPPAPSEQRAPDARSDIYALGMTLYHLLTAQDPTEAAQEREMRRLAPRDFNPALSADWSDLIRRSIDLNPENRPQDGAEFLEELEQIGQGSAPPLAAANVSPHISPNVSPSAVQPLLYRSGEICRNAQDLAFLADSQPNETMQLLFSGALEAWLAGIGEGDLAARAREIRGQYPKKPAHGLETLAQALGLEPPHLSYSPLRLNFGVLDPGDQKRVQVYAQNMGRGRLFGLIRPSHGAIQTFGEWDGNREKIKLTFDSARLAPGKYGGEIAFDSSAGAFSIPWTARVAGPSWMAPFLGTLGWGVGGMMAGALLRFVPMLLEGNWHPASHAGEHWLGSGATLSWWPAAPIFGLLFWMVWSLMTVWEAARRNSCWIFAVLGALGTLISVAAAVWGNEILIAGDAFLRPFCVGLVGNYAVGGWMFAGTLAGTLWGALKRPGDLFSPRIVALIIGAAVALGCCDFAVFAATHPNDPTLAGAGDFLGKMGKR